MYDESEKRIRLDLSAWLKLKPYIMQNLGLVVMPSLLNVAIIAVDIAAPLFLSYAIDKFIKNKSLDGLVLYSILYFIMVVIQALSYGRLGLYVDEAGYAVFQRTQARLLYKAAKAANLVL